MTMLRNSFRLWPAWIATLVLLGLVAVIAPQQIGVIAYKFIFLTGGAIAGYWVHVWTFGHITHDDDSEYLEPGKWRRTVFMTAGMIAAALAA